MPSLEIDRKPSRCCANSKRRQNTNTSIRQRSRSIVILLVIGFVPALIFSWAFELTPQGLKRDEDVPLEQSTASQTGRRMNRLIIAVLVLALGYFVFDKFVLNPRREKSAAGVSS